MDKIALIMSLQIPRGRAGLLSRQVSGERYFFLPPPRGGGPRWAPTLGGRETCDADYLVRRGRFAYCCLEYVAEGAGRVRLGGREAALEPGSVFAYGTETDTEIRTDPSHPMVKYFLGLAGPEAGRRLAAAGVAPGRARRIAAHAEIRRVFDDLIREGRHHGRATGRLCAALAEVLLLKLAEACARPGRRGSDAEERFLRCRSMIEGRVEGPASLAEIAAAVGLTPSSLCRLFRRYQGISPYRYLLQRKMAVAAEFLMETGGLVKEAAQRVGFADPYHFSRCFHAVHGIYPARLRAYRPRRRLPGAAEKPAGIPGPGLEKWK